MYVEVVATEYEILKILQREWWLRLSTTNENEKWDQGPKLRPAGRQCDWKFSAGDQNFKASRQQATNF